MISKLPEYVSIRLNKRSVRIGCSRFSASDIRIVLEAMDQASVSKRKKFLLLANKSCDVAVTKNFVYNSCGPKDNCSICDNLKVSKSGLESMYVAYLTRENVEELDSIFNGGV